MIWTEQAVLLAQGGYYALTGLWPIISIDSFQAITGPKTDFWLVRTVGVLVTVIAAVLILAARKERPPVEVVVLAIGTAVGLTVVDAFVVVTRTVSMVYLIDALVEVGMIAWWVRVLFPPSPQVVVFPGPHSREG